jgi:uncharacterized protein YecE (DUF72 family)
LDRRGSLKAHFIVISENIIITHRKVLDRSQLGYIIVVDYCIGTMGFSYKDWSGVFYPPGLAVRDYLSYYSMIFNAVEIDSTFYGIPKPGSVNRWMESTPKDFKISVKVPREITHEAGLVNVENEMSRFIDRVKILGEKLSVILIQFPPSFTNSHEAKLDAFLEYLPKDFSFAVEFRHRSWYVPETADMLLAHNICWVATEYKGVPKEVEVTSDKLFVRLVGQHGRFVRHDLEQIDVIPQLASWWDWMRSVADNISEIYVFFNDDFSGFAPASANKLKKMIGLPVIEPDHPKQMSFFE